MGREAQHGPEAVGASNEFDARVLAPRVRAADRGVGGGGGGADEVHEVQAEDILQQGVPEGGMEGRAQAGVHSLGNFHRQQGDHEKAIEEFEQGRAIAVEVSAQHGQCSR